MADHGPSFPKDLKKQVKNPKKWRKLATRLAAESRKLNSFLATTQAVDLIQGGVKVNALPEVVTGGSNQSSVTHLLSSADDQLSSITEYRCEHLLTP
jgi:Gly-Xaa carboxypeptidase